VATDAAGHDKKILMVNRRREVGGGEAFAVGRGSWSITRMRPVDCHIRDPLGPKSTVKSLMLFGLEGGRFV
jgi:hypothetical protein